MEERNTKPHDATRGGRCVLVSHNAPPTELMDALKRKQLDIREHRSVISAMSEIMQHARQIKAGATREPLVLLVVDRASMPRADELVAACTIYAPHAVAWTFDESAKPALRSYHSASPTSAPASPPSPANKPGAAPVPQAPAPGRPSPRIVISHNPPPSPQITVVRRSGEPNLRLAGASQPPAPPSKPEFKPADQPLDDNPPPLSDDELRMLLSDDWDPTKGMERNDR